MEFYKIYTDGYCSTNAKNNVGACSAVVLDKHDKVIDSVVQKHWNTTVNRLEILAAISGLDYFVSPQNIIIYTDSEYVANIINSWILKWKRQNWHKRGDGDIANLDIVRKLDDCMQKHKSVRATWIKSNGKDEFNQTARHLARFAAEPDDSDAKMGVVFRK